MSKLTQFLSNQSQHVMVDGCRSKLVNVVSGVQQGSVLGALLFILSTSELLSILENKIIFSILPQRFSVLENKLIGYVDDSTLMAVVLSPGIRITIAESRIRDLGKVGEWCVLWGMKLNASKTKTMIVSMSRTMIALPVTPINFWLNCTEGVW